MSFGSPLDLLDSNGIAPGTPVLFAYTCDLYRIKKFNSGLVKHEMKGIMYCFEYQADVLRVCCSELVEFQTLSYEKVKKRFFD